MLRSLSNHVSVHNNINDAMNNVIMVVNHQQKRILFLYDIHSMYFYLHFELGVQLGYGMQQSRATPSLYEYTQDHATMNETSIDTP